jgi:hypothetical protein
MVPACVSRNDRIREDKASRCKGRAFPMESNRSAPRRFEDAFGIIDERRSLRERIVEFGYSSNF